MDNLHLRTDNAFGAIVVPIVSAIANGCLFGCNPPPPPRSATESSAIHDGKFTLQIQTVGLSGDPMQTAAGLTAEVFTSDAFNLGDGGVPSFDSTTDWPVRAESLVDPTNINAGALARFTDGYVTSGTFVAGTTQLVTVPLQLVIGGASLTLNIHAAIITFAHTSPGTAVNGILAGELDVNELITTFKGVAGKISTEFCGSALDGVTQQIQQAADILGGRANAPGTPCTSISVGIGFHAKRIANPTMIALSRGTTADPCIVDAGSD